MCVTSPTGYDPPAHGGNLRWAAQRYGRPVTGLIDFSASINPLGPPPAVRRALRRALSEVEHYPDPDALRFREKLAQRLGVPLASTRALNGGAEGFFWLLHHWRPRRVIVPVPAFSEYARAAAAVGAELRAPALLRPSLSRDACRAVLPVDALLDEAMAGAVVVIANPNNPTGHAYERGGLLELHRRLRTVGARLLVDEAFLDFLPDADRRTLAREAAHADDLVVVGSLTKFFALPGLRLGYLIAEPHLLKELDRLRHSWPVNHLAQVAGAEALGDERTYTRFAQRTRQLIAAERAWLLTALSGIPGVRVYASAANFLLLELAPDWPGAGPVVDQLGRRGFLVRDASNFVGLGPGALRIAVRRRRENRRLVRELARLATDFGVAQSSFAGVIGS